MQVERGKTRPQTLMTGHTGYITHGRKILELRQEDVKETETLHETEENKASSDETA
jgi:hypothetical protein